MQTARSAPLSGYDADKEEKLMENPALLKTPMSGTAGRRPSATVPMSGKTGNKTFIDIELQKPHRGVLFFYLHRRRNSFYVPFFTPRKEPKTRLRGDFFYKASLLRNLPPESQAQLEAADETLKGLSRRFQDCLIGLHNYQCWLFQAGRPKMDAEDLSGFSPQRESVRQEATLRPRFGVGGSKGGGVFVKSRPPCVVLW
jgi:hypothetical protein